MKRLALLLLATLSVASVIPPQFASAAVTGFVAGRIIDDGVFTNKSAMNASQIQDFLNSKVPACDTAGSKQSEMNNSGVPDYNGNGSIQRWEWGKSRYNQTTFPCLRDYVIGDGRKAAQVIYDVSQTYNINPQVMIVLLQKEQGLVTDTWPLSIQYRSATGYGCPDTAACDSQYYGLLNQIDRAANMFRSILDDSPSWYTPYELGDNFIRYNPDSSCGGSNVFIQNRSTQALYNYTPYQPNQAALDAGWGTAPCGAYGNRNFYLYFKSWFGGTYLKFIDLSDPRWLQLKIPAFKINISSGSNTGNELPAGLQRKFSTKIESLNGEQCLRTQSDSDNNLSYCIPISKLGPIQPAYTSLADPESMKEVSLLYEARKYDIERGKVQSEPYRPTMQIKIKARTTVENIDYYITESDYNMGKLTTGIPVQSLNDSVMFESIQPVWLELVETTHKVTPVDDISHTGPFPVGMLRRYNSRALVNGIWYYRTETDTALRNSLSIPQAKLKSPTYENFSTPRWMQLKNQTTAYQPSINQPLGGESLNAGTQYRFVSKISLGGTLYFRTESDSLADNDTAFAANDLSEIKYIKFSSPRDLKLSTEASKYIPNQSIVSDGPFVSGLIRKFTSKIMVNGEWYYRTETDETLGVNKAFKAADLREIYE